MEPTIYQQTNKNNNKKQTELKKKKNVFVDTVSHVDSNY